jgi:hypothetical protein
MTNPSVLPSPPSLSPDLTQDYQELSIDMRRLFVKVFKFLWGEVNRRKFTDRGDLVTCYWALDLIRDRLSLTTSQLSLLSYLYQITNKGRNTVHSDRLYHSAILPHLSRSTYNVSMQVMIWQLIKLNYVSRSTRDLSDPYYSRSRSRHPVFIKLTLKGVQLIEGIEKDMYKLLLNSSLNDLTGVNKKP